MGTRRVGSADARMRKAQQSYRKMKSSRGKTAGPLIISGTGRIRVGSSTHESGLAQIAKLRTGMENSRPKGLSKIRQKISKAKARVAAKIDAGKSAVKTRLKKIGAKVKATQSSVTTKLKAVGRGAAPALPPTIRPSLTTAVKSRLGASIAAGASKGMVLKAAPSLAPRR